MPTVLRDVADALAGVAGTDFDIYTDPTATSPTTSPPHARQHEDINDAMTRLEKLVLARQAKTILNATTTVTNTTVETNLMTFSIPANSLAVDSVIRARLHGSMDCIATSGTFTFRVRVGANLAWDLLIPSQAGLLTVQPFYLDVLIVGKTLGVTGTVRAQGFAHAEISAQTDASEVRTPVVDTTINELLAVTVQMQTANVGNIVRAQTGCIVFDKV